MNFQINLTKLTKLTKTKRTSDSKVSELVEGVIYLVDGIFQVLCNNTFYNIHPDSLKTEGVRKVYARDSLGHWFMYDRPCSDDRRSMPPSYTPFRDNFVARGYIVRHECKTVFKIKKAFNPRNINEVEEANNEVD